MSVETPQAPTELGTFEPPKAAGRRRAAPARPPVVKDTEGKTPKTKSPDPMEKLMCITLHDNPQIPPGGQFVGVNGKQFWIRPGIQVVVPRYVLEALDNAVHGVPETNEKMQVVGVRMSPRITYTVHHDWDGKVA